MSKEIVIVLIRFYQILRSAIIDPVLLSVFGFAYTCKHQPTCSLYAIQQVRKHGTIQGIVKGVTRILHCH